MTGYELIARLKKTRRKVVLTATEQALYHELGSICNDVDWDEVFSCSNEELMNSLNLSEKTLIAARLSLIQSRLIFYRSGKSRRKFGEYSFTKNISTTVKIPVATSGDRVANTTANRVANASDYNKLKTKTQTKPTSEDKSSGPGASSSEKKKKDKATAEETTEHWKQLVEVWFEFYRSKHEGRDPTFENRSPKSLKAIVQWLERRTQKKCELEGQPFEWTEQVATDTLQMFLQYAYNSDQWLRNNFLLHNLELQFDKIINPNNAKTDSKTIGRLAGNAAKLAAAMAGNTSESGNDAGTSVGP